MYKLYVQISIEKFENKWSIRSVTPGARNVTTYFIMKLKMAEATSVFNFLSQVKIDQINSFDPDIKAKLEM